MRLYRYVGPDRIADRAGRQLGGVPIHSSDDVLAWIRDTAQELSAGCVIATFVVDASGTLLLADRHSEHVACAGGQSVRSAGEITFAIGRQVTVVGVSNQSTGYCPEPESWPAVAAALLRAGLPALEEFTMRCIFRRCSECANLTLVKDAVFECYVCGTDLPADYNCQEA